MYVWSTTVSVTYTNETTLTVSPCAVYVVVTVLISDIVILGGELYTILSTVSGDGDFVSMRVLTLVLILVLVITVMLVEV